MEFVLIDNDIITAHTERVSRLSRGVRNLQDKMSRIFGYTQNEQQAETVSQSTLIEPAFSDRALGDDVVMGHGTVSMDEYTEPVVEQPVQMEQTEMEQPVQTFDSDIVDDNLDLDGNLDLDLDQMIAEIRFDDDELNL